MTTASEQLILSELARLHEELYLMHKDVLTEQEAARWIGKKVSTLRSLTSRRVIAFHKPGGMNGTSDSYFLKTDLNEYMTRNRVRSQVEKDSQAASFNFKRRSA